MINCRDINAKVRVVKVDSYDNYSTVKLRTSRMDKRDDSWINSTFSFVRFVADAHKNIQVIEDALEEYDKFENGDAMRGGLPIVLKSLSISNESYEKDGEKVYPKSYQIIVWAWKFPEDENASSRMDRPPVVEEEDFGNDDDDEEIPF